MNDNHVNILWLKLWGGESQSPVYILYIHT